MNKWLGLSLLACLCLVFDGQALAAGKDGNEQILEMGEVVVTGARTEQSLEQVPANITIIDQEEIKLTNARSIPELLRAEEGLAVSDLLGNGKNAQVDLRGFGETGQYNTLVLVDGRRVNMIDLSGVDWTQIPLNQVERIEVLRGAGSVLYGDNAVGGVINIITREPGQEFAGQAGFSIGSYEEHNAKLSLSRGWDKVAASVHAKFQEMDGYRENNELKAGDIGGKIFFEPSDSLELSLSGTHHVDEFGLPGPLNATQLQEDREQSVFPDDEAKTRDSFASLRIASDFQDLGELRADVSYRDRNSDTDWELYSFQSEGDIQTIGFTPAYTWEGDLKGHWNRLTAGVDLYWTDLEQTTASMGNPSEQADIQRDSQGIYVHNEFSVLPDLILSLGARQERVEYDLNKKDLTGFLAPLDGSDTEDEQAYTLGLSYVFADQSSLFVRANRSIRFPLTDELIEYDFIGQTLNLNQLQPQTGQHYELGVRHALTSDIFTKISLFRAKIKDEIFYNPATFSNENHPETLHQGIEAGMNIDFLTHYTLKANYTYTKATFEDDPYAGNEVPAVPRHLFDLSLRIKDLLPGLTLNTAYRYVGSSYAISDQANAFQKKDDHHTLYADLSYAFESLRLFASLKNITGEEFSEYVVSDGTALSFYPARKTSWLAGIEYSF